MCLRRSLGLYSFAIRCWHFLRSLFLRRLQNGFQNQKSRWRLRFGLKTETLYCVICLEKGGVDGMVKEIPERRVQNRETEEVGITDGKPLSGGNENSE